MSAVSGQTGEARVQADRRAAVEGYLQALSQRNLEGCLSYFAEDATIYFQAGVFSGRKAIEDWHRDRFAVSFQVLDVSDMKIDGDTVVVDASITSDRVRAWKINKLAGKATLRFEQDRIKEARLAPRTYNPFEGW